MEEPGLPQAVQEHPHTAAAAQELCNLVLSLPLPLPLPSLG